MKVVEAVGSAERQYRLNEALNQYPVTNELVWWAIAVQRGHLTEEERSKILRNYRIQAENWPNDNAPVAHILEAVKIDGIESTSDKFFYRVCFNYDRAWGAEDRRVQAMEELKAGIRESVAHADPELMTIEAWVEFEFACMQEGSSRVLSQEKRFDEAGNAEEILYSANTTGRSDYNLIRRELPAKVFPLLDVAEVIKPPRLSEHRYLLRAATVARLFGDLEVHS